MTLRDELLSGKIKNETEVAFLVPSISEAVLNTLILNINIFNLVYVKLQVAKWNLKTKQLTVILFKYKHYLQFLIRYQSE